MLQKVNPFQIGRLPSISHPTWQKPQQPTETQPSSPPQRFSPRPPAESEVQQEAREQALAYIEKKRKKYK